MASTFTSRIRLEKQADGENPNSWGTILNANVIDMLDDALAAYTTVSCSSANITLSENNGTTDQSRSAVLEFVGTVSSNIDITMPTVSKFYIINDQTVRQSSSTITLKTGSGTGMTVEASMAGFAFCDSVSVYGLNAKGLGLGTAADLNFGTGDANLIPVSLADIRYVPTSTDTTITGKKTFTSVVSVQGAFAATSTATFSGPFISPPTTLTDAASIDVDFSSGNDFVVTLGGNRTLGSPSNPTIGQTGHIYIIQDGTGSRTASFGASYLFPAASTPTLSTSINSVDLLIYNVRETSAVDSLLVKEFG